MDGLAASTRGGGASALTMSTLMNWFLTIFGLAPHCRRRLFAATGLLALCLMRPHCLGAQPALGEGSEDVPGAVTVAQSVHTAQSAESADQWTRTPNIVSGERLSDWLLRDQQTNELLGESQAPNGNPNAPLYLGTYWRTPREYGAQSLARKELLKTLEAMPHKSDDANAIRLRSRLTQWLESAPITGRVALPNTNPRSLQSSPRQDPILGSSDTIAVPRSPATLTVIRPDGSLCGVAYRPHIEARYYVQACAMRGQHWYKDPDVAWVVQPDGSVQVMPLGSWNAAQQAFPGPGSWIWAPPRTGLWSGPWAKQFNDKFVQFLSSQGPAGLSEGVGVPDTQQASLPRVGPAALYQSSRNLPLSNNLWGETGLMQVPSARIAPAGTASISLALWQPYGTLNLGFNPLDWLEFTMRYTNVNNVPYGSQAIAGGQSYKDKSAGIKLRLWEEGPILPQAAIGVRDLAGTGLFSSEYAVISKRHRDFDFTLGLGWGQLGTRNNLNNPMAVFGSNFNTRPPPTVGQGGTVNTGALFHGTSALIGGIQYHTPWDPLVLKLELDGNSYQQTPQADLPFGQTLNTKTPLNLGAVYQGPFWDLTVALRGGQQVMLALSLHDRIDLLSTPKVAQARPTQVSLKPVGNYDPTAPVVLAPDLGRTTGISYGKSIAPPPSPQQSVADRAIEAHTQNKAKQAIVPTPTTSLAGIQHSGPVPETVMPGSPKTPAADQYETTLRDFEAQTQWAATSLSVRGNVWALNLTDASGIFIRSRLNRGIAVLHRDAPPQIEYFEIRLNNWGMLVSQYRVSRKGWMLSETQLLPPSERRPTITAQTPGAYNSFWEDVPVPSRPDAGSDDLGTQAPSPLARAGREPLQTGLGISYSQIVGGPDTPLLFALGVKGDATYKFRDNTWLTGTINARAIDNFGKYNYQPPPDGLYPVRTNIRQYMTTSAVTMPNLQVTNAGQLSENQFVSVYGGYLEMMFAGAGGEYLWRPVNSPVAVGANINRVYQRQFSQWTSLQNYSVNTGFVTAYWDTGVQDLLVKLSVGQYLAGDRGGTLDVSRVFQNGVKIGAYATRTNVSYAAFGEGSFDKGLYISVPFDAFFARHSDSVANLLFTPLIRNGGAMLFRKYQLYDMTRTRDGRALSLGPD